MSATTVSDKARLTPSQVIARIRAEAETNACFNAICHVFAIRERARQQVTLDSLAVRMKTEGYKFERKDYGRALSFLALMGIGYIEHDKENNVVALKNIRTTLQSIGQVGVGDKKVLKTFQPDIEFKDLPLPKIERVAAVKVPTKPMMEPNKTYRAFLTVMFDGTPVPFELPKGLTTKDLSTLLTEGLLIGGVSK